MVQGIFTACEGMKANLRKQEVITNNLANINTTGYKQTNLFTRAFIQQVKNDQQQPSVNDNTAIDEVAVDFTQGPMVTTQNPLDLAIEGNSFFTVQNANNTVSYTKSGSFTLDEKGYLTTLNGEKVLGETDRPILINGKNVQIHENGQIEVDGRMANKLKMSQFQSPNYLIKKGSNLYDKGEKSVETDACNYKIRQGQIEGSNVSPVESMVRMIASFRNYESDQKVMTSCDETLNHAVNDVARIR